MEAGGKIILLLILLVKESISSMTPCQLHNSYYSSASRVIIDLLFVRKYAFLNIFSIFDCSL